MRTKQRQDALLTQLHGEWARIVGGRKYALKMRLGRPHNLDVANEWLKLDQELLVEKRRFYSKAWQRRFAGNEIPPEILEPLLIYP